MICSARYRRFSWLLLCLVLSGTCAAQGPFDGFTKGKGVFNAVPTFSFNRADRFFGAPGTAYDLPFQGNTLALFAVYGATPDLDVIATGAYVFTSVRSGLQDGGLYAKYRFWKTESADGHRVGLLAASGLSFPLSNYEPTAEGALGQKAVVAPLRLIGQWDTRWGVFVNVVGGYNVRLDNLDPADVAAVQTMRPDYMPTEPPDFSTLVLRAGFPAARFYTDAWIEWQWAHGGSDYAPGLPDLPQAYGVSYTQAGGTLYYSENGRTGFILSGGYLFSGRNSSNVVRVTLGLSLAW